MASSPDDPADNNASSGRTAYGSGTAFAGSVRDRGAPPPSFGDLSEAYSTERAMQILPRWGVADEVTQFAGQHGLEPSVAAGVIARIVHRHGAQLFRAVARDDEIFLLKWIEEGLPVNMTHPVGGLTLLHYAAANTAQTCAMALSGSGRCNVLLRDHHGRLAWELSDDDDLSALLMAWQVEEAQKSGVPLTLR